jgi:hypothetical protein
MCVTTKSAARAQRAQGSLRRRHKLRTCLDKL